MKKPLEIPLKVGSKVVCILPEAKGAKGVIVKNMGLFGAGRKQLWKVKFPHVEYDLYSEMLRSLED